MNTKGEMDQIINDWLDDRVVEPSLDGLREAIDQTETTPQNRRRFPRWPFGTDRPTPRRTRLMLSTTGVITALAVIAVGVATVTTTETNTPQLGTGASLVVAADGTGDFPTLSEAIEAAEAGDTLLVQPGTYVESAVIDKDISIIGDGDRAEVIIEGYLDPAMAPSGTQCGTGSRPNGCTFVIREASPMLSGLTFRGDRAGIEIVGGSPVISRTAFEDVGPIYVDYSRPAGAPITVGGGSNAQIVFNEFDGSGKVSVRDGSEPIVEGNRFHSGSTLVLWDAGPRTSIRANHFSGSVLEPLVQLRMVPLTIEGNSFEATGAEAIGFADQGGTGPIIRGNTFVDIPGQALVIPRNTSAVIDGNEFTRTGIGIVVAGTDVQVTDNVLRGGRTGIAAVLGGDPVISGNVVDVSGRGITVDDRSEPTIEDNTVCGGITSIHLAPGATPTMGENRVCDTP